MDIKWEEPPGPTRAANQNQMLAEALKERPGQWARVTDYTETDITATTATNRASARAASIKNGSIKAFRPDEAGSFEAVGRQGVVYARYVTQ